MKRIALIVCLLAVAPAFADGHKKTADAWYKKQYAPLWKDAPWEKAEAIAGFYVETMTSYSPTGGTEESNTLASMSESMTYWRSEGWVSSELIELKTDALNPATASFKAKWLDVYEDGSEESSCGWYLATRSEAGWKFTSYTDIDCDEHGL
ncbi:MAG: hypothetical protein AAGF72_13200 [Pseudomonadota bacterium]